MNTQFVNDFISQSIKEGINSPQAICDKAKKLIVEIDAKLHEADALRVEKLNLQYVLVNFGEKSVKKSQAPDLGGFEDTLEFKELQVQICRAIEENGPLTNRQIIQKIGSYQNDAKVIRALKSLGEQMFIARDGSSDNNCIKGSRWNDRPLA